MIGLALDTEQRTERCALLSQVPALIHSIHGTPVHTYRLTFVAEVMQKMSDVMHAAGGGIRAIPIDANKQIVGQGILHPTTGVKALSAAAAEHYGLTEEECDFIFNYDITYRMSRTDE